MRVLVVTGRKAAEMVRKFESNMTDVLVLDTDIAAFTTPNRLKKNLNDETFDIIIIPGLVSADFSRLETQLNIPIRLGPKHAVDLGMVLSSLDRIELSTTVPACELLADIRRETAISTLKEIEKAAQCAFLLGNLKIGGSSTMKVMAEIVDATALGDDELVERILSFQIKGADIIDLGVGMAADVEEVKHTVALARKTAKVPLSIDTLEPDLITTAIRFGVDMVLSLNSTNIKTVASVIARADITAVVIPDPGNELDSLISNIHTARGLGVSKIIADPILDPPGQNMVNSIFRYKQFRQSFVDIPMFFGVGNITELMDVDSVGINALLTAIGCDVEADILFTPEYSDKARGSIAELKTSAQMMAMSKYRSSPPKDLGIDLLLLKEKRFRPFDEVPVDFITAKKDSKWTRDPAGSFKISISSSKIKNGVEEKNRIIAQHKKCTIIGNSAKDILDTVLDLGLISKLDHAGYLGRELMKAELALEMGRSYSQDDEF
ncbi:MAG: dihydropteroate synthase-like protein [Candidatus Methanomarinus sp.]|uniref:Dihydropteroate synthase-like protein n=1 Tax=Candidatus Methanomarinus sp. TaxID=3386244 RepID=A0AC61SC48_9EURY|nr:MAG: dihydropteroate synthase-like protein [ANME-2 cluster archaeon]